MALELENVLFFIDTYELWFELSVNEIFYTYSALMFIYLFIFVFKVH